MTDMKAADAPSPPSWGRVGEGGKESRAETCPIDQVRGYGAPCLDAALYGERAPSLPSPLRGEGERARQPVSERQRRRAKQLRREMTEAERKLWYALKAHRFSGLHFRRQVPMGAYIADFICHSRRLVIEVDGEQHGFERGSEQDRKRDAWFASQGYRVLRFWNGQVLRERQSVLDTIYANVANDAPTLESGTPEPSPPLWGRVGEGGPESRSGTADVERIPGYESPGSDSFTLKQQGGRPLPSPTRGEGEPGP